MQMTFDTHPSTAPAQSVGWAIVNGVCLDGKTLAGRCQG
jgi:hypothetical protein